MTDESYFRKGGDGFSFDPPKATVSAETSLMVGIAGNILLYHAAGPKIVVGPKATLKGNLTWDVTNTEKPLSGSASASMEFPAIAGFDVKIGSLKLGSFKTTFNLIDPYEIWRYNW